MSPGRCPHSGRPVNRLVAARRLQGLTLRKGVRMRLISFRRPASSSHRTVLRLDPMECRVTPSHTVTIAGPTSGPEGTAVTFTSTVTGATSPTYAWSVKKDGADFSTATTPDFTFTPHDNGT